jgi:glutamate 5-kinase
MTSGTFYKKEYLNVSDIFLSHPSPECPIPRNKMARPPPGCWQAGRLLLQHQLDIDIPFERQRIMSESQTLVVKLGTSVLTGGSRRLNRAHIVELVRQCAQLHAMGHRIVIVTSGAIAAGREHLGYPELPATIASKQLLAAVGQSRLIQLWEQLFSIYGIHVGQMLLTRADMEDRERFLNARDTLRALLDNSIVPVINENDAVATAEIKVGDNDNLSALAAILAGADKLLLLTDQPGLFTADPRSNPQAELIKDVYGIDDALRAIAGDSVSGLGTGGMGTKLQAADVACRAGIDTIIAAGNRPDVIGHAMEGLPVGTCFHAQESPLENRKRWIFGAPPAGELTVDAGATQAILERGSSLLPKGIVSGNFSRGEVIRIRNSEGRDIAHGVSRYNSDALRLIAGQHSQQIDAILGYEYGPVAVHRDDMIIR